MNAHRGIRVALVVLVFGALTALEATGASAAQYKCISSGTCFLTLDTGSNQVTQTIAAKQVCTKIEGQGSFLNGATTVTLTGIKYSGCTIGGAAATVNMNECDYKLGQPTNSGSPFSISTITLECPSGKEVVATATASGCTIRTKGQTMTGTTEIENSGTEVEMDWRLDLSLSNVVLTGSGGICGKGTTTGTTTGEITVTGFTTSEHKVRTGITVG